VIDRIIDGIAWTARQLAGFDAWIDRTLVDGLVNATAHATWSAGLTLKQLQTGHLRQYVMFIVIGTVALFVLASILFRSSLAG
jgi:NADH:ubiquinone oxidoreductase subunit 5 (subunit L)/multisubunit Na+/H+ antiporter MnhA subunit